MKMEIRRYPSSEELREIGKLLVAERHYWYKHHKAHNYRNAEYIKTGKLPTCKFECADYNIWVEVREKIAELVPYSIYEGVEPLNP